MGGTIPDTVENAILPSVGTTKFESLTMSEFNHKYKNHVTEITEHNRRASVVECEVIE